MIGICGANCEECDYLKNKKCKGCIETSGCPFGKKCWISSYIEIGGKKSFDLLKRELIKEFTSLNIDGIDKINDLYPLRGEFVNLEYTLPNDKKVKLLNDNEIYLGNQIECKFNDDEIKKCYGLVCNMNFLLVCEYEENGNNPEIIIYKKR
jgi:hypothetical protein